MTEYRVSLVRDDDCESPREYDNYGRMVLSHKRYNLPHEGELADRIDAAMTSGEYSFATIARWLRVCHGATVVLPVYGYDHGQLALHAGTAIGQFADPWDSGLAGLIYDDPAAVTALNGGPVPVEQMTQWLKDEVETYSRWGNGDCWGYVVEKLVPGFDPPVVYADDPRLSTDSRDGVWETVDSCWGFIGSENAQREGDAAMASEIAYNAKLNERDAQ